MPGLTASWLYMPAPGSGRAAMLGGPCAVLPCRVSLRVGFGGTLQGVVQQQLLDEVHMHHQHAVPVLSRPAGCNCGFASGARSRVLYSSSFSMRSTCVISMRRQQYLTRPSASMASLQLSPRLSGLCALCVPSTSVHEQVRRACVCETPPFKYTGC